MEIEIVSSLYVFCTSLCSITEKDSIGSKNFEMEFISYKERASQKIVPASCAVIFYFVRPVGGAVTSKVSACKASSKL